MLKPSPFLHIDRDRVYDPLTDRTVSAGEEEYERFRAFERGERAGGLDGWLISSDTDLSRRHHLKIVSLETMTMCNQKCYFCPVSIAPRADYVMPDEFFERIVAELTSFRSTLQ